MLFCGGSRIALSARDRTDATISMTKNFPAMLGTDARQSGCRLQAFSSVHGEPPVIRTSSSR